MAGSATQLADLFREADDDWLAALLADRPDLARPVPASLTALAGRAATRGSVGRALARLSAPDLTVLEAVVVLAAERGVTTGAELSQALGGLDVTATVQRLHDLALVLRSRDTLTPAPAVPEAIGPSPLGLGPPLRSLDVRLDEGWPTTVAALRTVMSAAPAGATTLLEALTWGPAVGTLGTEVPPAARWLLDHHVLHRLGSTEVVLPREVALAARGGVLARAVALTPPLPEAAQRREEVVAAEVVAAADAIHRQLEALLEAWRASPPGVLRAGGVAARDIKQLATALGASTAHAALICELAGMLGIVGHLHEDDGMRWAPTASAETWREQSPARRWARLVTVWLYSRRVPWLAGTRSEKGVLRAALDPELHRSWASSLRRRALTAVASWPHGAAPSTAQVRDLLAWSRPRSVPPQATVAAVLAEAGALGLLGAGALAPPTQVLLDGGGEDAIAAALTGLYPPEVAELVVQGDLTGIVPGRPTADLERLLELAADVDSRGAALSVRFSAESVGRAIAAGWSGEELLVRLRQASRTPVPQPLEYLVTDVARRHRRARVQPASTLVRTDDETATNALLTDPGLADLGLRLVGPTALVADATPMTVHEALRRSGAAPVLEGSDGHAVPLAGTTRRHARPVALEGPPVEHAVDTPKAVADMREGELRTSALLDGSQAAPSSADTLELLRAAATRGTSVRIVIAGNAGATQERVVRPLSVDAGRVRVLDTFRESELTIAPHRIVAVRPV